MWRKAAVSPLLTSSKLALAGIGLNPISCPLQALDLHDKLSIGGIAVWGGQCQELSKQAGAPDSCRGALPLRPNLSYRPTDDGELSLQLGFAAGNGINDASPFNLSPWTADLEDDVKNINGRGRNYLLTAWYRHNFQLAPDNRLSATLGLIDSTDYLDNNLFANDEYTQFMNDAFVNDSQSVLPSYDWGAALQWDLGRWSLRAVLMNVGKDDEKEEDGNITNKDISDEYGYFGAELGYSLETALGAGTYRVFYSRTSEDFLDPTGTKAERRTAIGLSFDQQLGKNLGAFLRIDLQADKAIVDYEYNYTGGFDIRGTAWGRTRDNVGLGFGYFFGGNQDISSTRVAEAYYRFVLDDRFAITADLQYMRDEMRKGKSPRGFILGLRADASF